MLFHRFIAFLIGDVFALYFPRLEIEGVEVLDA